MVASINNKVHSNMEQLSRMGMLLDNLDMFLNSKEEMETVKTEEENEIKDPLKVKEVADILIPEEVKEETIDIKEEDAIKAEVKEEPINIKEVIEAHEHEDEAEVKEEDVELKDPLGLISICQREEPNKSKNEGYSEDIDNFYKHFKVKECNKEEVVVVQTEENKNEQPIEETKLTGTFSKVESEELSDSILDNNGVDELSKEKVTGGTCRGCRHKFNSLFQHFKGHQGQTCKQLYSDKELQDMSHTHIESRKMKKKLNRKRYNPLNKVIHTTRTFAKVEKEKLGDIQEDESVDDPSEEKVSSGTCRGCCRKFNSLFQHFKGHQGQMCKQKYFDEELQDMSDAHIESRKLMELKRRLHQKQYNPSIEIHPITRNFPQVESEDFEDIPEDEVVDEPSEVKATSSTGTCRGCNHKFKSLFHHFNYKRGQMCRQKYSDQELQEMLDGIDEARKVKNKNLMRQHRKQSTALHQKENRDELSIEDTTISETFAGDENDEFVDNLEDENEFIQISKEKITGGTCRGCTHKFNILLKHFKGHRGKICKQLYSEDELREMFDAQTESRKIMKKLKMRKMRGANLQ